MFSIVHKVLLPIFAVEAAVCVFLCLPLPDFVVKMIVDSMRQPPSSTFGTVYYTIMSVIAVLFVNAVYEVMTASAVAVGLGDGTLCTDSQAVAYLSGFTLLLTRVSKKLFDLTGEHYLAKLKEEAMAKQAKGAADFARHMMNSGGGENDGQPSAPPSPEAETALQKQKQNQAAEYAKQVEDNEQLKSIVEKKDDLIRELKTKIASQQTQLEDMEAMMGTSSKKSS